jgi:hypothetical protein
MVAAHGVNVAKGAAIALLFGALVYAWSTPTGAVRHLSKQDLGAISASLASAYRDAAGKGALFVGTVGPEWGRYSMAQRERDAKNIVAKLQPTGVREVLLYDAARRVAVHHSEGRPLAVGP